MPEGTIFDENKASDAVETETPATSKKSNTDPLQILLQSLKTFPKQDLITIRDRTESLIARREKAERTAALKETRAMVEKYGFTPEELAE